MQPTQTSPEQKAKNGKIFRFNILLLLSYFVLFIALAKFVPSPDPSFYLFPYLFVFLAHAFILFLLGVIALIRKESAAAGMYFLCVVLIPLIAFGACTFTVMTGFFGVLGFY